MIKFQNKRKKVAKGRWISSDPTIKIHGILLGQDFMKLFNSFLYDNCFLSFEYFECLILLCYY